MTDQNRTNVGGLWKNKGKGWKGTIDWTAMEEAKAKGHNTMNVFENTHKIEGDNKPDYNMIMYPKWEGNKTTPSSPPPVQEEKESEGFLTDDIPF
ncbi:MAG: hypothetical protein IID17_14900 [Nitrospinae bacterium]|nr:hypothetical protein [Nitrospinota bacterium]